jgi:hypothetical protein
MQHPPRRGVTGRRWPAPTLTRTGRSAPPDRPPAATGGQPMNPSRTDQAGRALPPERARVNGEPRTGDGRLAGGRIPGRAGVWSESASRTPRPAVRPSQPSERRCAPGHAPDTRPRVRCITKLMPCGRRLPAAGHRTPALAVPLLRTPAAGPPIWSGPPARQPMRTHVHHGEGARAAIAGLEARAADIDRPAPAQPGRHQPQARGGHRPGSWAGVDRSVAIGAIWMRAGPEWQRLATPACARPLQS